MKVIAVYNHKGGVGKTVTAVNFAYNLSVLGYRVLLIDMDPQGNRSAFYGRYSLNKASIAGFLIGRYSLSRCIYRTHYKNLDIIQGNMDLRKVTREQLGKEDTSKLLSGLIDVESRYDFCIIDCPPAVNFLIETVMVTTMDVIVPMKSDRFSVDGLDGVVDIVNAYASPSTEIACLFTQFYKCNDTNRAIEHVTETTNVPIYESKIRRSCAVDHSIYARRPLLRCASRSTTAEDYVKFTKEYLEKMEKEEDYDITGEFA